MIKLRVENAQVMNALSKIAGIRSRLTKGIHKTLEAGRLEGSRLVQARYVKDYATGKMKLKVNGLNGSLSVTDRRHSLTSFIVKPGRRPPHNPPGGLRIKVRHSDNETLPRAFLGRGQVFERVGRSRLPIKRLTGPSGAQELGSEHIAPQIESRIGQHIQRELERAIMI